MYNLRNRSFLKELDFSRDELGHLLTLAAALKTAKYAGNEVPRLAGHGIEEPRIAVAKVARDRS